MEPPLELVHPRRSIASRRNRAQALRKHISGQAPRSNHSESPGEPRLETLCRPVRHALSRLSPSRITLARWTHILTYWVSAPCSRASRAVSGCTDAKPAPERFAHLRRLSPALLLSALPVTGAGGASLRVRVWAFTAMRGRAANAHKPFDSLGEKHYG